jgi:methylmalonyl-CoA mutase cobalamin-binding subunit
MGFDRAFPPGTRAEKVIEKLNADFAAREASPRRTPD